MFQRLRELFHELNCIQYAERGKEFPLASGGTSYYKIVCDPLFVNKESRTLIGKLGYEMFRGLEDDYDLIGILGGGYEVSKLVAEEGGLETVGVNPHNGQVIGKLEHPYQCYFEDVVTLGGSVLKGRKILGISNGSDNEAIALVLRDFMGKENLKNSGINLEPIFTKDDLGIRPDIS